MTRPSWKLYAYFVGGVLLGCAFGGAAELAEAASLYVLVGVTTMCGVASIALGTTLAIGELW